MASETPTGPYRVDLRTDLDWWIITVPISPFAAHAVRTVCDTIDRVLKGTT